MSRPPSSSSASSSLSSRKRRTERMSTSSSSSSTTPSKKTSTSPPEYVLALHDYNPQDETATCIRFCAGQIIRVWNRDPSGWWDGQVNDQRGWFPSNYVKGAPIRAVQEVETGHVSELNTPTSATPTRAHFQQVPPPSTSFPPIMDPLLNGLELLQNAVRANKPSHIQPSTACIVTCVRSLLSVTGTSDRNSPILKKHPPLLASRRSVLGALTSLVAQTKKLSQEDDEARREVQASIMLKFAGQVVASVRQFALVCVQCGVELPEPSEPVGTEERLGWAGYTYARGDDEKKLVRARSFTDLRGSETKGEAKKRPSTASNRLSLQPTRREGARSTPASETLSIPADKVPSSSSRLRGLCTTNQVLDALRQTHDHYLSTIAAFIGHAHTHSRRSHASNAEHILELVRDIVKMISNMFMIADAVFVHPDIHRGRLHSMREAQDTLQNVVNAISDSVRMMGIPSVADSSDDDNERHDLLMLATAALKAGAECVSSIKICLTRSVGEEPLVIQIPASNAQIQYGARHLRKISTNTMTADGGRQFVSMRGSIDMPGQLSPAHEIIFKRPSLAESTSSFDLVEEDAVFQPYDHQPVPLFAVVEEDTVEEPALSKAHEKQEDSEDRIRSRDFEDSDVIYNESGQLLGASLPALVELMTPHDTLVDAEFSNLFFSTFRFFCPPLQLAELLIQRYNLSPPSSPEVRTVWEQQKLGPVRLRVSNFIRMWVELHWKQNEDEEALELLLLFVRKDMGRTLPSAAHRILELLGIRATHDSAGLPPPRTREGSSHAIVASEIPRPIISKSLLSVLRAGIFEKVAITDFDILELARQLSIMECHLYCAIPAEEILETGKEGVKPPVNVKAVAALSTGITSWVAESILSESDIRKRTGLLKFFIKLADRCLTLNNFSTTRSILAALDSSTISRLQQTWAGLAMKYTTQLNEMKKLSNYSRNYHDYRQRLRNASAPGVPFLGLYLTDVTFCREGNPSLRISPTNPSKRLVNFSKYTKLVRVVEDVRRFQVPYNLRAIPEVQQYLHTLFQVTKRSGDLQELYRRSLAVEPKESVDAPFPPKTPLTSFFQSPRSAV